MKRTWKFLRATLWMGVIAALVVVMFKASHPMMDKYHEMAGKWQTQAFAGFNTAHAQGDMRGLEQGRGMAKGDLQQLQRKAGPDRHYMEQGNKFADGIHHGKPGHRGFDGVWIVGLLLLVAGALLWKRGGRARLIGGLLIAAALLPLLLKALVVIVPAMVIYFIWRSIRRRSKPNYAASVVADEEYTAQTVDFLDEWETKTRLQLKNKESKEEN